MYLFMSKFAPSANQDHIKLLWPPVYHALLPSPAVLCAQAPLSAQPVSKDTTSIRLQASPPAFHALLLSMDVPPAKLTPLVSNATMVGT